MKKIKFLGAAVLAASLIFAGCSSPAGAAPEINNPIDNNENNNETGQENNNNNNNNENGQNENNNNQNNNNETGNNETGQNNNNNENELPNTGVYKEYLIGAPADGVNSLKSFQDWGNGSKFTDNADGSITITAGTGWGESRVNLAYGDIPAGYFTRFDRVVAFVDESNFTATKEIILFAGSGDDPVTVTPIKKDGLSVYVANISASTKAATSTQIALQLFGTGSVTVKSWYFEADSEIAVFKKPLTDLLALANELKESATVGTDGGNYPQDAYDAFIAAIETAQTVESSNESTQSEIYAAYKTLAEAKGEFEATKIPDLLFTSLSGVVIPEDATVLFKADDASNSLLTPNNNPWYIPAGGSFTIKLDDYSETAKIYEVVTKGDNSCGCFDLNVPVTAGQKLYVSCYSKNNTSIKPVAPDAETLITGSNEWQLIEVEYSADCALIQLGVVGKTEEENSLFIDAVYIK